MKDITYERMVCDYCDYFNGNGEPNQTRLTVGGDRIQYPGDCSTPTADQLTVEIMHSSIISTPGGKFHNNGRKKVLPNTPKTRYEHLWLCMSDIPDNVK